MNVSDTIPMLVRHLCLDFRLIMWLLGCVATTGRRELPRPINSLGELISNGNGTLQSQQCRTNIAKHTSVSFPH